VTRQLAIQVVGIEVFAFHGVLPEEITAILEVTERWGAIDRSHRKLAHRGSYEQLVWVSPSTAISRSSGLTWRRSPTRPCSTSS
jgi:hypothetical protein